MRLLTKTTMYYLLSTLGIFLLGGVIFYLVLMSIIDNEVDEKLVFHKGQILQKLDTGNWDGADSFFSIEKNVHIRSTTGNLGAPDRIRDTLIYDPLEKEYMPYRQLVTLQQIHGKPYQITIREPLVESESLTEGIAYSLIALFLILIIVLLFVHNRITNRLWVPFYNALDRLKNYEINQPENLHFDETNVREFEELNRNLSQMTSRIREDYRNLKEFTENVSHEIQTPLAIIKSKLELLMQSEEAQPDQMNLIQSSYQAANRLSKLNQALILLAKIENQEFPEITIIHVNDLVEKHLEYFRELIDLRELDLQINMTADPVVSLNPSLGDILISNLISNAIKHNVERGSIGINLNEKALTIINTGEATDRDPSQFFHRFTKDGNHTDSTGLGLSIVWKICKLFSIEIQYSIQDNLHIISLVF